MQNIFATLRLRLALAFPAAVFSHFAKSFFGRWLHCTLHCRFVFYFFSVSPPCSFCIQESKKRGPRPSTLSVPAYACHCHLTGWLDSMSRRKQRNGQHWQLILAIFLFPVWHPIQSPSRLITRGNNFSHYIKMHFIASNYVLLCNFRMPSVISN